jgi:hypothetical protein
MTMRVRRAVVLTKMFRVKHFCPIGAENLTSRKTSVLSSILSERPFFFGAIELWAARSLDGRVQRSVPSNV